MSNLRDSEGDKTEQEVKPIFVTEYKRRLFKVVGGNTVELPDGSKVIFKPDFVVSADYNEKDKK